jgi:hypothetical protein
LDTTNGNGEIKPASARKLELYPFRGGESKTEERESGSGKCENVKEGMKGIVSGQRDGWVKEKLGVETEETKVEASRSMTCKLKRKERCRRASKYPEIWIVKQCEEMYNCGARTGQT